jgi:hypothetical protein
MIASAFASTALALPGQTRREQEGRCDAMNAPSQSMRASWSRIRRSPGCWFFSGPGDLGRDDHLGSSAHWARNGERVELRFGSLSFTGTITGNRVIVRRESTHQSGSQWRVTETIQGSFTPPDDSNCAFVARYHYDECQQGGECPGSCHIDATIRFSRR